MDINIAALHSSSSDVETRMLEEIKQLKERSRRQEKVIDELINNKMHHESEERTKVPMSFTKLYASKFVSNLLCELADHFQIDHDKIQNHVVSSNRKVLFFMLEHKCISGLKCSFQIAESSMC